MKATVLAFSLFLSSSAFAFQIQSSRLTPDLRVRPKQSVTMSFGERINLKMLLVQAESSRDESQIEVWVNGHLKGSLEATGPGVPLLVAIEENADSVEFRHRGGSAMKIKSVTLRFLENTRLAGL